LLFQHTLKGPPHQTTETYIHSHKDEKEYCRPHTPKIGVTQTDHAGVTQTEGAGVTQTAANVQEERCQTRKQCRWESEHDILTDHYLYPQWTEKRQKRDVKHSKEGPIS